MKLQPINCVCKHRPKLAMYGVHPDGTPYIHVKIYKAQRLYGEFIVTGGTFKVRCRECFRWHKINIQPKTKSFTLEDSSAEEITDTELTET